MSEKVVEQQTFQLEDETLATIRGEVRVASGVERKPVLLLVHGFKGFKDWGFFPYAAERLAYQGFAVVTFNLSHNGVREHDFDELEKFGRNTYSREQADLAHVVAAVRAERLPLGDRMDTRQLFLVGHSRGGGNCVLFAADHPEIGGVVTWNGVGRADLFGEDFREQVMREGVGYVANARTKQQMPIEAVFFEDLDRNRERFDIPARAAELQTPVLFIQGMKDAERLLDGFRTLRQQAPHHRFAELADADHTFGVKHPFAAPTDDLDRAIAITAAFFAPLMAKDS
ncbi:alpha/beta hydrolase family protein [Paenibacillus sp. 1P07SE]|uniref:alpha/beta hydrolase family protein n=1 Tax=Paenibacillus sp. 1P07SE TaxID=3132209 RepID=UPI0039A70281